MLSSVIWIEPNLMQLNLQLSDVLLQSCMQSREDNSNLKYDQIISQITHLDRQNKKLIVVADNILKTSFLRPSDQTPTIIIQFQEEMRHSFNALIDSIREYFISLDDKAQQLGRFLQSKVGESKTNNSFASQPSITSLTKRMDALEENLRRTQQNEARLMILVENVASRQGLRDQQPTLVRSREQPTVIFNNEKKQQIGRKNTQQTNFRLFSINTGESNLPKQMRSNNSIPYSMVDSEILQRNETLGGIGLRANCSGEQGGINRIGEFGLQPVVRRPQLEGSNRMYRLSALVRALKQ